MDVLGICRDCEEPNIYWATTRPPPRTTQCNSCGGVAVLANSSTGADITQLFNEIHPGATPRKTRAMVGKLARKIERGQISVESLLRTAPKGSAKKHREDIKVGTIVFGGLTAATAGYVLSSSTSLDEQAHALALNVLQKLDRDNDWIPGPGDLTAVLERQQKPERKKDNPGRNRSPNRIAVSGAPKPSRPGVASAKKKRP